MLQQVVFNVVQWMCKAVAHTVKRHSTVFGIPLAIKHIT